MNRNRLSLIILTACISISGAFDQTEFTSIKKSIRLSLTRVEYRTYEDIVKPLKKKLDKNKIDEIEFQVETKMVPKGGIFAAEIKTGSKDPIVKAVLSKDSIELKSCDIESSEPGLTNQFNFGSGKWSVARDENRPILVFECKLRQPLPDSVTVMFVSMEGKSIEEHLLFKRKK
jgi:hypothetical protein